MDKKLTLSLDAKIIDKAKTYAKDQQTSLSKLIEAYLGSLIQNQSSPSVEVTPFVSDLGIETKMPNDLDYKQVYTDYLVEKYK